MPVKSTRNHFMTREYSRRKLVAYRIELDNGGVKSMETRFDRNWTGKIGLYLAHSSAFSILESVC